MTHIQRFYIRVIEFFFMKCILGENNIVCIDQQIYKQHVIEKQTFLKQIKKNQKIVFYLFRETHWIDWFCPIHRALEKVYPDQFTIIYISYASLIKRVGTGFELLRYRDEINQRLLQHHIPIQHHFSYEELNLFESFPQPNMVVYSERIKVENFSVPHRVYLPHYFVLKAIDKLPTNIIYNHVFQPSKGKYTYQESLKNHSNVTLHPVGYPKMHALEIKQPLLFNNQHPVIIYAPSHDESLLIKALNEGIINIFKEMKCYNFIIKLHPSLNARRHYLGLLFQKYCKNISNLYLDSTTSIQDIALQSSLLITDFGNVGAEYMLTFGKRVLYLKVPKHFEGGSDLLFRDRFADATIAIQDLTSYIPLTLAKGDLKKEEKENICKSVLYSYGNADETAAHTIANILQ